MKFIAALIIGVLMMNLVDRAIWRQTFIFLSIEKNISGWSELESSAPYDSFNPAKWIFFILIPAIIFTSIDFPSFIIESIGALLICAGAYLFYAFKLSANAFRYASAQRIETMNRSNDLSDDNLE